MAGTDLTILIAYGIAVVLAVLLTAGVWLSTGNRRPVDTHRLVEFERTWLLIVATVLVGPNLDEAKPPLALVVDRVSHGKGAMPAFKGQLTDAQIKAVATYVVAVAGR